MRYLIALAMLRAIVASCARYPFLKLVDLPPGTPPEPLAAALADVNASLHAAIDSNTLPGFAFSFFYAGREVISFGGGIADKATGRAPDPHTDLFRIASNTKLFVSQLAEIFESAGILNSLDEPVRLAVPEFVGPINIFGDGAEITWRNLMSHTAGLPDSLPGNSDWTNMTTPAVLDALTSLPLVVPVGTLPLYSNLGIALLGHLLAEAAAPAAERGALSPLLEQYILQPLGLAADTGYDISSEVARRLIPGYDGDGVRVPVEDLGWAAPCGTMWSSVVNLARFHQATATAAAGAPAPPGYFLTPTRARAWLQPSSLMSDGSIAMGAPWETFVMPSVAGGGVVVRTKSGTLSGYATKSAVVPELRLSFALSYNGNFADWYTGNALVQSVAATLVPALTTALQALQPPADAGPSPNDFVGTYVQVSDPSTNASVTLAGGVLSLASPALGDPPAVLDWAGARAAQLKDTFLASQDPGADTCEHTVFGDIAWKLPVVFTRGAGGAVSSLRLPNFDGEWLRVGRK